MGQALIVYVFAELLNRNDSCVILNTQDKLSNDGNGHFQLQASSKPDDEKWKGMSGGLVEMKGRKLSLFF